MSDKVDRKQIKNNIKQTSEIDNWLKTALDGEKEELAQLCTVGEFPVVLIDEEHFRQFHELILPALPPVTAFVC